MEDSARRQVALIQGNVDQALDFFNTLKIPTADEAGVLVLEEVRNRLTYLKDVGLGYLTLDRLTRTLSGGEAQRIRLAAQLSSGLQGVLYVLDEPSIGLHARDHARLLGALGTIGSLTIRPIYLRALDEQLQCIAELADRTIEASHDRVRLDRRMSEVREMLEAQSVLCAEEQKA